MERVLVNVLGAVEQLLIDAAVMEEVRHHGLAVSFITVTWASRDTHTIKSR